MPSVEGGDICLLCSTSIITAISQRKLEAPLGVDGPDVASWLFGADAVLYHYTGHPAVVVPCAPDRDDLPLGMQMVG